MTNRLSPPLKWHGGKHYLAPKIVALMPAHIHYVEPYFGGGSVLLAKEPEGISEVANDLNSRLVNFWKCLACPLSFVEFARLAQAIPFCEKLWNEANEKLSRPCDRPDVICISCGLAFFVACRQSLAGRMASFAPLSRTRVRVRMNEQASAWLSAVDGLPEVHSRMRRVAILDRSATYVIRSQDGPKTLFYCDPPYLHETRATTTEYGPHEMTTENHKDLLDCLADIDGKFLLSGYPSTLYDSFARDAGWTRHDFELPNNAASGSEKRVMTECVWTNF